MSRWQGKSKGTPLGYRIFVSVCRKLGLAPAYLLLHFVAFYYFLFSSASSKTIYRYFRDRHHLGRTKAFFKIYGNYYLLGQTLIDKMVVMASLKNKFTYHFDGMENLRQVAGSGKGGILLSAHVGNWEMAGHHLWQLNSKINVVMFDGEHERIKVLLNQLGKKNSNVIIIKDDMSHVYAIGAALANRELVCMHADRFLAHNKTIGLELLGAKALFPAGPFQLAAGFNVPVSFVYGFRERNWHYHFFGSPMIQRDASERKSDFAVRLAGLYVSDLERKVRRYPEQWFNYYDFWTE
jgi:predicted LPLAT superfamily acyltransferase